MKNVDATPVGLTPVGLRKKWKVPAIFRFLSEPVVSMKIDLFRLKSRPAFNAFEGEDVYSNFR
jgi:hypothetical protein